MLFGQFQLSGKIEFAQFPHCTVFVGEFGSMGFEVLGWSTQILYNSTWKFKDIAKKFIIKRTAASN